MAALADDERGYRAKGDANATWERLSVEHGQRRRTAAELIFQSHQLRIIQGVGVFATPPNRGMRGGIVEA